MTSADLRQMASQLRVLAVSCANPGGVELLQRLAGFHEEDARSAYLASDIKVTGSIWPRRHGRATSYFGRPSRHIR